MSDTIKTEHAFLLNELHAMEMSVRYSFRKNTLQAAQKIIIELEQEIQELKKKLEDKNG